MTKFMQKYTKYSLLAFMAVFFMAVSAQINTARADGGDVLQLVPSQTHFIHLSANAATVAVGNPAHLTAILDQPDRLLLIPGAVGATSLTVLDAEGNFIFHKQIIISGRAHDHVTVTRNCAAGSDCAPVTMLNCAAGCVRVYAAETMAPTPEPTSDASEENFNDTLDNLSQALPEGYGMEIGTQEPMP